MIKWAWQLLPVKSETPTAEAQATLDAQHKKLLDAGWEPEPWPLPPDRVFYKLSKVKS